MQTLLEIGNTRQKQILTGTLGRVLRLLVFFALFISVFGGGYAGKGGGFVREARAQCVYCFCSNAEHAQTYNHINNEHQATQQHIEQEFEDHRQEFIVGNFFGNHVLPAMMMMTEQLTTMAAAQTFMIGTFFDAEIELDTQRDVQELAARAHKDYHPSFQMCTIGTMAKNLGATRRQAEYSAFALHQGLMDRQSLNYRMAAAGGTGMDSLRRWFAFVRLFCDPYDNGGELEPLCVAPTTNPGHMMDVDGDVDYTRIVDNPLTISANYTTTTLDADEAEIFALGSNLFGADLIDFKADALFYNDTATGYNSPYRQEYMRIRGILAKRSVAQNSFANIVGMKSSGSPNTFDQRTQYMRFLLEQLGMDNTTEITRILGGRPSYHAQMELLTKKIYQRPEFYTNLYDKPANVDRTKAAMRAIGLMQGMDMFNSRLRSEMLLSVAAELQLMEEQERVQDILFQREEGMVRPD